MEDTSSLRKKRKPKERPVSENDKSGVKKATQEGTAKRARHLEENATAKTRKPKKVQEERKKPRKDKDRESAVSEINQESIPNKDKKADSSESCESIDREVNQELIEPETKCTLQSSEDNLREKDSESVIDGISLDKKADSSESCEYRDREINQELIEPESKCTLQSSEDNLRDKESGSVIDDISLDKKADLSESCESIDREIKQELIEPETKGTLQSSEDNLRDKESGTVIDDISLLKEDATAKTKKPRKVQKKRKKPRKNKDRKSAVSESNQESIPNKDENAVLSENCALPVIHIREEPIDLDTVGMLKFSEDGLRFNESGAIIPEVSLPETSEKLACDKTSEIDRGNLQNITEVGENVCSERNEVPVRREQRSFEESNEAIVSSSSQSVETLSDQTTVGNEEKLGNVSEDEEIEEGEASVSSKIPRIGELSAHFHESTNTPSDQQSLDIENEAGFDFFKVEGQCVIDMAGEEEILPKANIEPFIGKVGVIGCGPMAKAIIFHLISTKHTVCAYNRTASKLEVIPLKPQIVATPAALVEECDIVLCCIESSRAVRRVMEKTNGVLAGMDRNSTRKVYVEMSLVHPSTIAKYSQEIRRRGGSFLTAQIGRTRPAMYLGCSTVTVSGDRKSFKKCSNCFAAFSSYVTYLGTNVLDPVITCISQSIIESLSVITLSDVMLAADKLNFSKVALMENLEMDSRQLSMVGVAAKCMADNRHEVFLPVKHVLKNLRMAYELRKSRPFGNETLVSALQLISSVINRYPEALEHDISCLYRLRTRPFMYPVPGN